MATNAEDTARDLLDSPFKDRVHCFDEASTRIIVHLKPDVKPLSKADLLYLYQHPGFIEVQVNGDSSFVLHFLR